MAVRVSATRKSMGGFANQAKKAEKRPAPKPVKVALESLEKRRYQGKTSLQELVQSIKSEDAKKTKDILYKAVRAGDDVEQLSYQAYEEVKSLPEAEEASERFKCSFCQMAIEEAVLHRDRRVLDRALARSFDCSEEPIECVQQALQELGERAPHDQEFINRLSCELEAISEVPIERHNLTPLEMIEISLVAENTLEKLHNFSEPLYLRAGDSGLTRCLFFDPTRQTFTILSKRNGLLQAEGTFKRVTDAIEVAPFKDSASAQRVVRSVSKEDHEITDKELELERRYGKILSWVRYDAKHRHETKTMILQEGFDNDLYLYTKYTPANERQKLPLHELVDVLLQVGETLQEMHDDGYVHRDFKVKNVLYRKGADGTVEAKLIDFGHSYRPDHERYPRKRAKGYGTLRYTSPEALEFPKDISDPRLLAQAEDMYAIGCLIYEIYFQKELPWGSDTYKACKKDDPDGDRRERAIKLQKREAIKLLGMSHDRKGTPDGDILFIMSRLLEPNPRRRIKMAALLESLKRLQTNLNP